MPESSSYVNQWLISSRAIEKSGIYRDIISAYPVKGKNTLELGCGWGFMTEKLWKDEPKTLLSIDHNYTMLQKTRGNLEGKGLPVNYIDPGAFYICYASVTETSNGKNKLDEKSINLLKADYADYRDLGNPEWCELYDTVFLVFAGGTKMNNILTGGLFGSLTSALNTIDPLLKKDGRFIYVDKIFFINKENIMQQFAVPPGYELNEMTLDEDISKVMASLWGNRNIATLTKDCAYGIDIKGAADGTAAKAYCQALQDLGYNSGILTMEFVKT